MTETFWTLLRDPAHWEFEMFLMLLFDGLIFGLLFPFVRVHWRHHIDRDKREKAAFLESMRPKFGYTFTFGIAPPSIAPEKWKVNSIPDPH